MAGHSKWANIKHKKAKTDAKRGKIFTRLIREITVAARLGGGVPDDNPRLRLAVDKALGANMPKDTIERAIQRGAGGLDGDNVEELTYEGYGPGGVAILVEVMTDNRNRTVAEIRHLLSKRGGNLGTDGSVGWMFDRKGLVEVKKGEHDFDAIFEAALEAGAEDVEPGDETFSIYCAFTDLHEVSSALEGAGFDLAETKPVRLPTTTVSVEGSTAETTLAIMELLDEHDDVANVFTNADISDEEMERLSAS